MPVDHVNGVDLYWERTGSGPRLLFCNGSGQSLRTAQPVIDSFTRKFELLTWDYRGLGRSAPLTGAYAMADLVADAACLLDLAGWRSCRIFGVSFGGMVAQEFAVTYPERVQRLVLACTSAGGDGGSSYPLQQLRELAPQERIAVQRKLTDSRWDEHWLETHPMDRVLARSVSAGQDQREVDPAGYKFQLDARAGHDVWDRLGAIDCPVLVGYGEYDQIAPAKNSAAIASRIPGAELRGYDGGHLFMIQDAAALPEFHAFLSEP